MMRFLRLLVWMPLVLMLVAVGCGTDDGTTVDTEALEAEVLNYGPYEVGFREMAFTYSAVASGKTRDILVRMWYPAVPDSGAGPAEYALAGILSVPAEIALDSPPVAEGDQFPLTVHSHGSGGDGLTAGPYGELMASHGWIVAVPNHIGNTALDGLGGTTDPFARIALDRPADITAVIDWLESGLGDDELAGVADTSAVFVFGHSFGGYTTLSAGGASQDYDAWTEDCAEQCPGEDCSDDCVVLTDPAVEAAYRAGFGDSRVVAIAPQAPAVVTTMVGLAELEVPMMLMSGRQDKTTPHETTAVPAWMGTDHPDDLWVELPMGAHYSFVSVCHQLAPEILALFIDGADDDGCDFERFTPTDQAIPILAAYVLAFGRRHVLGEVEFDALLRGPPIGDIDDQFTIVTR